MSATGSSLSQAGQTVRSPPDSAPLRLLGCIEEARGLPVDLAIREVARDRALQARHHGSALARQGGVPPVAHDPRLRPPGKPCLLRHALGERVPGDCALVGQVPGAARIVDEKIERRMNEVRHIGGRDEGIGLAGRDRPAEAVACVGCRASFSGRCLTSGAKDQRGRAIELPAPAASAGRGERATRPLIGPC